MKNDTQINGNDLFLRQRKLTQRDAPVIVCDGLRTPENLGSILRVADAVGSKGIILLDSNIDLKNKKITRLSRSASQHVPVKQLTLQQFTDSRSQFNKIYALEITQQSISLFEAEYLDCDAVILGHESTGIRNETLGLCNGVIHLPMFGTNGSMNVSHALAVFLYDWRRQKKH